VVPGEPDLRKVLELPVARDLVRREVAVVVEDRLRRRVPGVELARRGAAEQVVVGKKGLGGQGVRLVSRFSRAKEAKNIGSRIEGVERVVPNALLGSVHG